jgi:hypothetical protein
MFKDLDPDMKLDLQNRKILYLQKSAGIKMLQNVFLKIIFVKFSVKVVKEQRPAILQNITALHVIALVILSEPKL